MTPASSIKRPLLGVRQIKSVVLRTISASTEIHGVVANYFEVLFVGSTESLVNQDPLPYITPLISNDDNEALTRAFSRDEFKIAISQMHVEKAMGPDGFNPRFY